MTKHFINNFVNKKWTEDTTVRKYRRGQDIDLQDIIISLLLEYKVWNKFVEYFYGDGCITVTDVRNNTDGIRGNI